MGEGWKERKEEAEGGGREKGRSGEGRRERGGKK